MYTDIVFPKDNEASYLLYAEKLGWNGICFVHDTRRTVPQSTVKVFSGVLGRSAPHADLSLMRGDDVRRIVEKIRPDIVFDLEGERRSDGMHERHSGLDHISCSFAKENKVTVGFSFESLLNLTTKTLGRVKQNIRLCRTYKVPMLIASFATSPYRMRSPHDLQSLFVTLGMHPKEAQDAQLNTAKLIERNRMRRHPDYISEGVSIIHRK